MRCRNEGAGGGNVEYELGYQKRWRKVRERKCKVIIRLQRNNPTIQYNGTVSIKKRNPAIIKKTLGMEEKPKKKEKDL